MIEFHGKTLKSAIYIYIVEIERRQKGRKLLDLEWKPIT